MEALIVSTVDQSSTITKEVSTMKVTIVGCGGIGACAGGLFAREKEVKEIVCADVSGQRAEKLASQVSNLNPKVKTRVVCLDATDENMVSKAVAKTNLVYNATYPNCNIPILRGCMQSGASYLDLAAYPPVFGAPEGTTTEDLLKFDADAKSAGITAITNMGVSPGFTNIAAHYVINQLDTAEKVRFKWFDRLVGSDLVATWWAAGLIYEWFTSPGPIIWENGEFKVVDLIRTAETYDFPSPVGKGTVYTSTLHPELYMLPNYLPDGKGKSIKYVDLMGGYEISDLTLKDIWIEAIRRQTIKGDLNQELKSGSDMIELFGTSLIQPVDFEEAYNKGTVKDGNLCVLVEVTGRRNGREVRHTIYVLIGLDEARKRLPWTNHTAYVTALSGVIAAMMIYRGEINQKGVMTADMIDKPETFLKEYQRGGVRIVEKVERDL
jgi:saccharopine dehydrogenase-like NADP-dependent oxidoreductase